MDKAIVERALRALAEIGAARPAVPELPRKMPKLTAAAPATPVKAESSNQEALRDRPATCSPDCYELEPDIWIHRPHTGCTTIKPEASESQRQITVTCWHCRGEKRCACIACWQAGPGDCVTCKGIGQVWRWVQ